MQPWMLGERRSSQESDQNIRLDQVIGPERDA